MKKYNAIKTLCIAVVMAATGFTANAQLEQSVFLSGNIPTGRFATNYDPGTGIVLMGKANIGKAATMGLGFGYRATYVFDVGFGEVAPFLNADFQWNRVKKGLRENYMRANASKPNYLNIPVMVGIGYRYMLTDIIKVFGEFGVGADFFSITPEGNKDDGTIGYCQYHVKPQLAWQVGGGAFFGSHVSASLHYYGLGQHAITYNESKCSGALYAADKLSYETGLTNKVETPTFGSIVLRIGFHF